MIPICPLPHELPRNRTCEGKNTLATKDHHLTILFNAVGPPVARALGILPGLGVVTAGMEANH